MILNNAKTEALNRINTIAKHVEGLRATIVAWEALQDARSRAGLRPLGETLEGQKLTIKIELEEQANLERLVHQLDIKIAMEIDAPYTW